MDHVSFFCILELIFLRNHSLSKIKRDYKIRDNRWIPNSDSLINSLSFIVTWLYTQSYKPIYKKITFNHS